MSTSEPAVPAPAELSFPQRPSTQDTKNDSAATLAWLKTNVSAVYLAARTNPSPGEPPRLSRSAYLDFYTTAHDYCMVTKTARSPPLRDDLYHGLRDAIQAHCSEVRKILFDPKNVAGVDGARHTIGEYLAQWQRFTHVAFLVANLLRPLEKDWISRLIDEKRKDVYRIKELHTNVWKTEILQIGVDSTMAATGSELQKALVTLQEHGEDGVGSDNNLVERFLESLKAIGVGSGKGR